MSAIASAIAVLQYYVAECERAGVVPLSVSEFLDVLRVIQQVTEAEQRASDSTYVH